MGDLKFDSIHNYASLRYFLCAGEVKLQESNF